MFSDKGPANLEVLTLENKQPLFKSYVSTGAVISHPSWDSFCGVESRALFPGLHAVAIAMLEEKPAESRFCLHCRQLSCGVSLPWYLLTLSSEIHPEDCPTRPFFCPRSPVRAVSCSNSRAYLTYWDETQEGFLGKS